jgi:hypothetical protein
MDEGEAGGRGGGLMAPQRRALTVGLVLTVTFVLGHRDRRRRGRRGGGRHRRP